MTRKVRSLLVESTYGAFRRDLGLPKNADPASIEASLSDGLLVVEVSKASNGESPSERTVEIR